MCIWFVFINEVFFAALLHTDRGFTCSDSGFIDLSTDQECSDAVNYAESFNYEANYKKMVSWPNNHKGCLIKDSGDMYFNLHPIGRNDASIRSICKKGDK